MNDFDYDVMSKKRIASGDRYRKLGSKSRKCSLPSDNLTEAQLRKLNGPILCYNLSRPMTYGAFKAMPEDLQREYLKTLHKDYGATYQMIAGMFGCSAVTVQDARTALGLPWVSRRGLPKDVAAARDRKWEAFLNGEASEEDTPEEDTPEEEGTEDPALDTPKVIQEAKKAMERSQALALNAFSAEFTGPFNLSRLLEWLSAFPVYGMPQVRIQVEVEIAEGGEADEVPAHAAPADRH